MMMLSTTRAVSRKGDEELQRERQCGNDSLQLWSGQGRAGRGRGRSSHAVGRDPVVYCLLSVFQLPRVARSWRCPLSVLSITFAVLWLLFCGLLRRNGRRRGMDSTGTKPFDLFRVFFVRGEGSGGLACISRYLALRLPKVCAKKRKKRG